jgi:hypothetical protein
MQRALTVVSFLILAGCQAAAPLPVEEPPLTLKQALGHEYVQLQHFFGATQHDWNTSAWFARKRDILLKSSDVVHDVPPDEATSARHTNWNGSTPPRTWIVGGDGASVFQCLRIVLEKLLSNQTVRDTPVTFAHAQARYDCWLAEVGRSPGGYISGVGKTECRLEFGNVVNYLEAADVLKRCGDPLAALSTSAIIAHR